MSSFPSDRDTADILLRTTDGVEFYAHKVILSHSSSFFRTMFTLPQSSGPSCPTDNSDIPTVDVPEDSQTLDALLHICYPIVKDKSRPFEQIEPALRAALKYEMVLPVDVLTQELHAAASTMPLRVWAVACRTGLEQVARPAAKLLLRENILDVSGSLPFLEGVSAADYFRLRHFYRNCGGDSSFNLLLPSAEPPCANKETEPNIPGHGAFCRSVPYSDVTCRSSDGVDLPSHRCVLAMASPVLRERLASTTHDTPAEGVPPLPVLEFRENSAVLVRLLDVCCYLQESLAPSTPSELVPLITSAHEYGMEQGLSMLTARWEAAAKLYPLDAYFSATRAGWEGRARQAAKRVLDGGSLQDKYDHTMEHSSLLAYHRLLKYYDRVDAAVNGELQKIKADWKASQNEIRRQNKLRFEAPATLARPRSMTFDPFMPVRVQAMLRAAEGGDGLSVDATTETPSTPISFQPTRQDGQQWSLSPLISSISSMDGPRKKAAAVNDIASEYLKWRSTESTIPYTSSKEASNVLIFARAIPKRLEDVINRVELEV
ncbi:hypothetical protein C8Q80DRAFT_1275454 [Daedaleopsis nitida]|nr:hypothetical protein C8Q80DRAFT_1275454 [Daedaleopsis nitida]